MKQAQRRIAKGRVAKSVLRLPDLEVAKSAVLNTLSCPDAQRGYRHAIDEFVDWYCSEAMRLSGCNPVLYTPRGLLARPSGYKRQGSIDGACRSSDREPLGPRLIVYG